MTWPTDIRFALRQARRRPLATFWMIAALAVGIGANVTIFSFVKTILLEPLPFPEADRLVAVWEYNTRGIEDNGTVSPATLADLATQSKTVEFFGAWRDYSFILSTPQGTTSVTAGIATPEFFRVLGLEPLHGRLFNSDDNRPGSNHVLLISHSYWNSRFGGDVSALGSTLTLDGEVYEIIGVLPPTLDTPSLNWEQIWAPHSIDSDYQAPRNLRNRMVFARLRKGIGIEEAEAELRTIAASIANQYPGTNRDWSIRVRSLHEFEYGAMRPTLVLFGCAVGFLLIMACVNVMVLLLSRSAERIREFHIRTSLGASTAHMTRLLLTEGGLLSLIGGATGVFLALWWTDLLVAVGPQNIPRIDQVTVDHSALVVAVALMAVTALIFGLTPMISTMMGRAARPAAGLRNRSTPSTTRKMGNVLLVAEIAAAMLLLTGSTLFVQSYFHIKNVELGFDSDNVLVFHTLMPAPEYEEGQRVVEYLETLSARLTAHPNIVHVGMTSAGPLFGGRETARFTANADSAGSNPTAIRARYFDIDPGYFPTMITPILSGRNFTEEDGEDSQRVVIVNQTLAEACWPDTPPIGRVLLSEDRTQEFLVVGVAQNTHNPARARHAEPEVYWPKQQVPRRATYVLARTNRDPNLLIPDVHAIIADIDSAVLVRGTRTLNESRERYLHSPRFQAVLTTVFAIAAVIMALTGIFGIASQTVIRRMNEFGIRLAFGADRADIIRLVLIRDAVHASAGILLGIVLTLMLAKWSSSLLYGIRPADPVSLILSAMLVLGVVLLAEIQPIRRAIRVDPRQVLHVE